MLPLRDNIPTRRFPIVCVLLIGINVLVFLADKATSVVLTYIGPGGQPIQEIMGGLSVHYALIPAYVTGHTEHSPLLPLTVQPAWLTIFTSMFLHANLLHIGGNMLYLWIFGNNIEDVLGRGKFLLFYLVAGLGAALLQILSDPGSPTPTLGASGAIAGVMGAYIVLYPGARILCLVFLGIFITFWQIPAVIVIGFWFILQVLNARLLGGGALTQGGGVAYLAHVGGFVTGMTLIVLLGGRRLITDSPPEDYP